ncbi:hypothetical protein V6N13_034969 [Hibiscus sabdariffa]
MTPSPLDRKTKANEAEPRWRDRLVLTRLFYHSGIQNGATGGDAEATRVGLVRYDIKRPHAGALFTALYLKQCAVTLQQAYGGITPYDIHTKLSVPVSLTRSEVRDWLRGLIRKLANRYLSQALSRPREYRGNRLGRLCQRIVSDLPCISIRNDAEAYIERISSLIYGHPLPDILVMNGMPLGEGMK